MKEKHKNSKKYKSRKHEKSKLDDGKDEDYTDFKSENQFKDKLNIK